MRTYLFDVLFENLRNGIGNARQFSGEVCQGYDFMANVVLEILHSSPPIINHHLLLVFPRHDGQVGLNVGFKGTLITEVVCS